MEADDLNLNPNLQGKKGAEHYSEAWSSITQWKVSSQSQESHQLAKSSSSLWHSLRTQSAPCSGTEFEYFPFKNLIFSSAHTGTEQQQKDELPSGTHTRANAVFPFFLLCELTSAGGSQCRVSVPEEALGLGLQSGLLWLGSMARPLHHSKPIFE